MKASSATASMRVRRGAAGRAFMTAGAAALILFTVAPAAAHKPSDSYLTVTPRDAEVDIRWDIAVRDLDYAIGVDHNGDGNVTWSELRRATEDIRRYAGARLSIAGDGQPCTAGAAKLRVVTHSDGAYAVLLFTATCPRAVRALVFGYELLLDLDPQHRGIARVADDSGRVFIFGNDRRSIVIPVVVDGRSDALLVAIRSGVHHIWTGYDHVLFLLALLLPAVLRREQGVWIAVPRFAPALADVARVVTAFTVAHSITLTLAALGFVSLPSRLVESVIAASVLLAATNNVFPLLQKDRWTAAFVLGLLHGFGFSSTLDDGGLTGRALLATLFGFNAGVEIGQLAIVGAFVPLAFAARHTWAYRRLVMLGGSLAIAVIASLWLIERAFDVVLLSR